MKKKTVACKRVIGLLLAVAMLLSSTITYASETNQEEPAHLVDLSQVEETTEDLTEGDKDDEMATSPETEEETEAQTEEETEARTEEAVVRDTVSMNSPTIKNVEEGAVSNDKPVYPKREESLTPLSNLAEGFPVFLDDGSFTGSSTGKAVGISLEKIVNGDKYDDELNNAKSNASVYVGNSEYITIDLGEIFSLEVINIKRAHKKVFRNTAVILATEEDFSDGVVIYYQEGMRGMLEDYGMKIAATSSGQPYQETYGGEWFYMKGDGVTPTAPMTVRQARYVRIYSADPEGYTYDESTAKENGFVEVGVYGYQDDTRMAQGGDSQRKNRIINGESPLIIHSLYSNSLSTLNMTDSNKDSNYNFKNGLYFDVENDELPVFKHEDTIAGRWAAIPENQRKNSVLLIHTDNLGMNPGSQWSKTDYNIWIRQEMYQEFYERSFAEGYRHGIPMMMISITAGAVPLDTKENGITYGGLTFNLSSAADYGWVDLMYRMYPNFEGGFNPENHWIKSYGSNLFRAVAVASGLCLESAALHNGYFIWCESAETMESGTQVKGCQTWINAIKKYGDKHLYMMYKTTGAIGREHSATSYMQGMWLAGYAAGWGGLVDTWSWADQGMGNYGDTTSFRGWKGVAAQPEAMAGAQIISSYLEGACVYSFEHPAVTTGVDDMNTPMYNNVISKCYDYFIEHPAPTRAQILADSEYLIYGNISGSTVFDGLVSNNANHTGQNGNKNRNFFLYDTGRYGSMPAITNFITKAEVAEKLNAFCKENGIRVPSLINVNDPVLTDKTSRIALFNEAYEKKYSGDAFADIYDGKWFVYHSEPDPLNAEVTAVDEANGREAAKQSAILPITVAETGKEKNDTARLKATVQAHSYVIADAEAKSEGDTFSLNIHVNNYRTDIDGLANNGTWGGVATELDMANDSTEKSSWDYSNISFSSGNFAVAIGKRGQQEGDPITYNNLERWCAGLWEYCRAYICSPLDYKMRTTTFEITKLEEKPVVRITDALEWDGVKSPQVLGEEEAEAADFTTDNTPAEGNSPDTVKVEWEESTGKATITLQCNGWVDLEIANLKFARDESALDVTLEESEQSGTSAVNLATGSLVEISVNSSPSDRPTSRIVDNITTNIDNNYVQTNNDGKGDWIQIDLRGQHEIDSVQMWRYYSDSRAYKDTIVLLSPTADFNPSTTLVLWNAYDNDNQVTWWEKSGDHENFMTALQQLRTKDWLPSSDGEELYPGYDYDTPQISDVFSQDAKRHDYTETSGGYKFNVSNARIMLDGYKVTKGEGAEVDIDITDQSFEDGAKERFTARYVRVYTNGRTDTPNNSQNHIVEIKVNGVKGKLDPIEISDSENPVGPFSLKVKPVDATTAELSFDAASDNIRVIGYDIEVKRGESVVFSLTDGTELSYTIPNLIMDASYTISVTSKDARNNRNTVSVNFTMTLADSTLNEADVPDEGIPDGVWVAGVATADYSGKAITQNLRVYDQERQLKEKTDYTLVYKNNTNAYTWEDADYNTYIRLKESNSKVTSYGTFDTKKAPSVTVNFKNNYSASITVYFKINKQNIANKALFTVDDLAVTYTGKRQVPVPTVIWNVTGKAIRNNKDYVIEEYIADQKAKINFFGEKGKETVYTLTLVGKGNFEGRRIIKYTISKGTNQLDMRKITAKGLPKSVEWTEDAKSKGIVPEGVTLVYKNDILEAPRPDADDLNKKKGEYTITYLNNKEVGTATMIVTGTGVDADGDNISYIGTRRFTYKITGQPMSKLQVANISKTGYTYTGEAIKPLEVGGSTGVTITHPSAYGGKIEASDYVVTYQNNINKGTATIIFTGKESEGYTGSKKQTFKIVPENIQLGENSDFTLKLLNAEEEVQVSDDTNYIYDFIKGGVKPAVWLSYKGKTLKQGIDYTVAYKNNSNVASYNIGSKAPTLIITGKGNFTGKVTDTFTIQKKDVTRSDDVYIVAKDKVETGKANGWKQSIKVYDADGKILNAKDYDVKNIVYRVKSIAKYGEKAAAAYNLKAPVGDDEGTILTAVNTVPEGVTIEVEVSMKGNYAGKVTGTYRILGQGYDISKATIKIANQEYTGKEILITDNGQFVEKILKNKNQEKILFLRDEGQFAQNIRVVEGSYEKNLQKGTAKVTFEGLEGTRYGGTKTVTFKIGTKTATDYWQGLLDALSGLIRF